VQGDGVCDEWRAPRHKGTSGRCRQVGVGAWESRMGSCSRPFEGADDPGQGSSSTIEGFCWASRARACLKGTEQKKHKAAKGAIRPQTVTNCAL